MSIGKKLGFDIRKNTPSDLGIYFLDLAVEFANKNRCLFQTEAICEIRRYLNEAGKIFNSVPPARFILSHGDYSPFNLVFESKNCKVIAVNDFDNVGLLLRVHDLAEAILTFSYISYQGCSSNFANVLPEKINFQMASAVLKGYTSVIKLENDEKRVLDRVAMSIWIELISLGIIREDFGFARLFDFNNIRKQVESFFKKL
jgi:thiamine kinase-like enzyme